MRILRCDKEDGTPGGPAVVARRPAADGKPTILLYAHHDVQPTGDLALWETEPFTAVERDGRLYGRGAADDKAGILAHIAAYAAVTRVLGDDLGLGVTFFFEGEEEAGSPTFRTFLETHRELLRADVIVVADSSNWKVGIPALTTSLRGLVDGTIEVKVLDHAVHSGMFGGPVLDAPTLLSRLIATLHDDEGNVAIAGLVSRDDATVDLSEEEYRARRFGARRRPARRHRHDRLAAVDQAGAVDHRLRCPGRRRRLQHPPAPGAGQVQHAARPRPGPGRGHGGGPPACGSQRAVRRPAWSSRRGRAATPSSRTPSSRAAGVAMWALGEAWGVPAVETGIGGSIPFIADLTELYPEVQILVTGVEDPDSRAHSANESLHLGDFRNAVVAEALLLARLNEEGLA